MKYVHFFATATDIMPPLSRLESKQPLKYIQTGKRFEINRPIYLRALDIPNPSISTNETGSLSATYLVSSRDIKNVMYTFIDDNGRRNWHLSNGDNPDSVLLTMAGIWKTGTLLPGNMSTMHDTPAAQRIIKDFHAIIKDMRFFKYNVYWVGPEASAMLGAGRRLVFSEQAPAIYNIPRFRNE